MNTELYCAKLLYLEPGAQCSLHKHRKKDETFRVLDGRCTLEFGGLKRVLAKGDLQRIRPGVYHRFRNERYAPICVILEVSTHHDESDVIRKEPSMSGTGGIPTQGRETIATRSLGRKKK